tara:strand:- start:125 stop:1291 length:1167 start_codon:yes stop_codon:yes gene_type:complete
MEFFDKKQDVLDLKLTSYGKQLLSRGLFKPAYYSFSDDGVMYDPRWVSGSLLKEHQSEAEQRIQEQTPRLKTQYRKVGAERGVYNTLGGLYYIYGQGLTLTPGYSQTIQELLEMEFSSIEEFNQYLAKLNLNARFAESEKLLENTLGVKSYFNSYNPSWNVLLYNGNISSSTPYYKKNDITTFIPQLNCTLNDQVYKLDLDTTPIDAIPEVKNIQSSLDNASVAFPLDSDELSAHGDPIPMSQGTPTENYFQEFSLDDGTIFLIKDFLFISTEEANVEFTNDNFTVEVFEVTTTSEVDDGEEKLQKLIFANESKLPISGMTVESVFEIELDNEIDAQLACSLIGKDKEMKDKNIYNTKTFDCATPTPSPGVNVDPYENLPDVNVGDVC